MNLTRFPVLRARDRCGNCGRKVHRQVRLEPTSITCPSCGFAYTEDGLSMGYGASGMTRAEYEQRQATRERSIKGGA